MICNLCKEEINTKKERYVNIVDYDKEKIVQNVWVHLTCFKKGMNRELTETEREAQQTLKKAQKLLGVLANKIDPDSNQEEYVIQ